ncbi:hypothetical protein ACQCVP_18390 [Rossellomorea vietnamensis]
MPVGAEQGAYTFYTGEAEEAHRPPPGKRVPGVEVNILLAKF